MPNMDGVELIKSIRRKVPLEQLVIIGLSDTNSSSVSVQFIKNGANDFLHKPFAKEEFNCRVMQNMELLDKHKSIQFAESHDFLTKMLNRKHFFDKVKSHLDKQDGNFSIALLDIDHFKHINDEFGEEAGNQALVQFSSILAKQLKSHIFARFNGNQFGIFFANKNIIMVTKILENLRKGIKRMTLKVNSQKLILPVVSAWQRVSIWIKPLKMLKKI